MLILTNTTIMNLLRVIERWDQYIYIHCNSYTVIGFLSNLLPNVAPFHSLWTQSCRVRDRHQFVQRFRCDLLSAVR